ncbi:MAG: electron transfer flavoprotein subunit alpha [Pseudomonadota bacterium]
MGVIVDLKECTGCGLCRKSCPYGAVEIREKKAFFLGICTSCGACLEVCPTGALTTDLPPRELAAADSHQGVFVFAEQRDGGLNSVALELLGCARELADRLGQDVSALLLGDRVEALAGTLFAHGADRVFLAEDLRLSRYHTLPYARVVAGLIKEYRPGIFLLGATPIGRDLAPRLARRLNLGLTADCTGLEIGADQGLIQTRPAFGGNILAAIISPYARPQMATVRPGVMKSLETPRPAQGELVRISPSIEPADLALRILEVAKLPRVKVDFSRAKVIVAGGRGVGGAEGFRLLEDLARALGAELGGTRVAVEEGWIPQERQIGQTGRAVRPELYLACGISGAIQHRAGMVDSRYIAAINRDPDAPIFKIADFRLVGDVRKIVPALIKNLEAQG